MIFDSKQQQELLFQMVQIVPINGPYQTARQQIVQVEDMLQAINAGEIKQPDKKGQAKTDEKA